MTVRNLVDQDTLDLRLARREVLAQQRENALNADREEGFWQWVNEIHEYDMERSWADFEQCLDDEREFLNSGNARMEHDE